jgi:hypothetical protein
MSESSVVEAPVVDPPVVDPPVVDPPVVDPPVTKSNLLEEDTLPQAMLIAYAKEARVQIQLYHLDVFIGGLLIGTHLPRVGWMMLSYSATFPVLIAFQHPEIFSQMYKKKPEYGVLLVSGLIVCQTYALYCLRNLFV